MGFSSAFRTKKQTGNNFPSVFWARRDSNPRPKDYESSALPLRHRPVTTFFIQLFLSWACGSANLASLSVRFTFLSSNLTFSQLLVGRVPQARDDFFIQLFLSWACGSANLASLSVRFTFLSSNLTFSQLLVGRVPQARDDFVYTTQPILSTKYQKIKNLT